MRTMALLAQPRSDNPKMENNGDITLEIGETPSTNTLMP